ncbi:I78 family peptidase inhibitor [Rhodobacteraceae bacterium D3-12]|nr:I78 family peptidase inhibitor [Rhodobacteraceae bacterium D3-12]
MSRIPRFPFVISLAALSVLALLTACQPHEDIMRADATCAATKYEPLVGTPAEAADFSGEKLVRIIAPGTAVTMDYRADRLNVETDKAGIITRVYCG